MSKKTQNMQSVAGADRIERIKGAMKSVSDSLKLPEAYREDLELDHQGLTCFDGCDFVWLLRTNGTVLVPTNLGIDPAYITYWLWGNHGQKVVPFFVSAETGLIEKITFERAEQLIMQPPCELSSMMSNQELSEAVHSTLERGCELKIWGQFESPGSVSAIGGWSCWQSYFASSGNRMMADFMGKAIRYIRTAKVA